jgi:anaerobic ribonucleoside-triphosphate reductase
MKNLIYLSIEHINIENTFKGSEQAWDMLCWVAEQGVTYFAFNGKVSQCKNYHSFYGDICPECGERKETEYTRTVGFYTPIKTWSKQRKEEYVMREWEKVNE